MLLPTATELPRWMEPTTRDPFLDEAPSAVYATAAVERADRLLISSAVVQRVCCDRVPAVAAR